MNKNRIRQDDTKLSKLKKEKKLDVSLASDEERFSFECQMSDNLNGSPISIRFDYRLTLKLHKTRYVRSVILQFGKPISKIEIERRIRNAFGIFEKTV